MTSKRPTIRRDGLKHVAHLANRVTKAMRDAGCSDRLIEDMRSRILDANNRWSLDQALAIAREYVTVEESRE